jgi:hypothetical protein
MGHGNEHEKGNKREHGKKDKTNLIATKNLEKYHTRREFLEMPYW